jgi:transcriptional regulator with XRE-family HTH domain
VAGHAIAKRFGHAVRRRRVAAGLSQEALAGVARVHPTYISLLERGLRDPKLSSMQKLAHALGISVAELASEAETRR